MNFLLLVIGIFLIILILADIFLTTIQFTSAGFISGPLYRLIYRLLVKCSGNRSYLILNYSGMIIILINVIVWILFLWIGFFLVFLFEESSVIDSVSHIPGSAKDKFYFAGYSLATLGNGDFKPLGSFFQIVSVVASLTGLTILTFIITYLTPVLTAVTEKREIAAYIYYLGSTPERILENSWNGKNFDSLQPHLIYLTGKIQLYSERHLAYPVLHYFHSNNRKTTTSLNIAVLYEVILILRIYLPGDMFSDTLFLHILKGAIDDYSQTLATSFLAETSDEIPLEYCEKVASKYVTASPGISRGEKDFIKTHKTRKMLKAAVEEDLFSWEEIYLPNIG